MSQSKVKNENSDFSDYFFSNGLDDEEKNSYDDPDYFDYDDFEVADKVLIPIEEESEAKTKSRSIIDFGVLAQYVLAIPQRFIESLYSLGDGAVKVITAIAVSLFTFVKIPAVFFWQKIILPIFRSLGIRAKRFSKRLKLHDYKKFHDDAKRAIKNLHEKKSMTERREAFKKKIVTSFTVHRRVWLTAANTAFPIVCLVLLILTVSHYGNTTYALKVNYNGQDIGYIASENIFNEARDKAVEMLSSSSTDSIKLSDPTYSVEMLTPDKLSDTKTLCDKIIGATDGNFVNACGIYIDGDFICAVKNETDAISVFENILKPYEKKAGDDATVAFVQEIKYVQGLYSDTEDVIWDSDKLEKEMNSTKSGAVYYTVKNGDSPLSISSANNISYAELEKLNPSIKDSSIHVGDKLLLSAQINNIRVKVMKTETRKVTLPYETETKESATLYKGTSKTVQTGQNGEQKITELVTYIDGVKTYATTVSTVTTKNPVKEIIYKGTKEVIQYTPATGGNSGSSSSGGSTSSGGSYTAPSTNTTGTSFGSPMAASYYYSSPYGGRTLYGKYNFHRGVDLCHAGGSGGIPVLAVQSGTVVSTTASNTGYGYSVLIRHSNGLQTRYAHMQAGSITVKAGQTVSKGQQIGRVGSTGNSTGNHLHFEVIKNGTNVNPRPYLPY